MTQAGRRHTLVSIERATVTQDAYGEEVETWAAIASEWAAIYYGKGYERRQAASEQGTQPATFNMLSNSRTSAILFKDRLVLAGVPWDIDGIALDTPKRGEIEITAIRSPL